MSLRIALLGLLKASGPASGYDLAKKFEHSLNHVWQAQHSQIYPELVKMAADGLIAVEAEGARGRKIYALKQEGDEQLREWMLEHQASSSFRSETALQAFLLPVLDPEEAIAVVQRLRAQFVARQSVMECIPGSGKPGFGRYALQLGLAQVKAGIEWADSVLDQLNASSR